MIVCTITSNDIKHHFVFIEEPITLPLLLWFSQRRQVSDCSSSSLSFGVRKTTMPIQKCSIRTQPQNKLHGKIIVVIQPCQNQNARHYEQIIPPSGSGFNAAQSHSTWNRWSTARSMSTPVKESFNWKIDPRAYGMTYHDMHPSPKTLSH